MKSFIFGSDGLPKTPEELARLRAMADALTPSRSPQNVGEGIASIGNAIVYRALMNKADQGEAAGKANADSMFSKLFGGGEGAFPSAPTPVGDATAAPPAASPKAMAMVSPGNDPVADVLAAGPKSDQPWLKYANQGATRSQPLDPKLVSALGFLPDLGVSAEVFSGGQPTASEGGPRTGSARHDHGGAGDVFFYKGGRKLDWANEQDRPIFEEIVRRGKANGITGFGAGDGYMQPGSMHLGFGAPAVWGAGGKGANAPDWLRKAYAGESDIPGGLAAQPGMAATAAPVMGYAGPAQVASAQPTGANGAPIAQDWLPAEFQQSAQLRGANPDVGVLRALLGKEQPAGAGQQTAQALDLNQAIQTMSDPFLAPGKRAVLEALVRKNMDADQARLEQQLKQQSPDYQLDLKLKNAQLDQILNPQMSPGDRARLELEQQKLGIEQQNRNTMTAAEKAQNDLAREKFGYERETGALTPDLKEYRAYAEGEKAAGRQPLGLLDYQIAVKRAGANSTTVNTGEGSKFYGKLDEQNAQMFSNLSDGAIQARSKLGQIDRLEQLMSKAPQGAVGALKQAAGEWGIPTTGLSDIQAASALLESLVPQQRPPGSGTMSDSDIKMYRASLPRLLNQPGGNQLVFQTMRGIAQYEMQMGDIADRVANREITPAEGRSLIKSLKNPLADFKPPADGPTPNEGWKELPGVPGGVKIRLKGSQ